MGLSRVPAVRHTGAEEFARLLVAAAETNRVDDVTVGGVDAIV